MLSRHVPVLARAKQTLKAAAIVAMTGALSCSGALPTPSASRAAPARLDVETRDLPPRDEIEGLLRGSGSVGRAHKVVRVAIPPFRVLGSDKAWVGDAAAEVLIAKLSHAEGVSLLERGEMTRLIEELKKANPEREVAASVSAGKLLGAQSMILGSMVPQGDGFRLVLKPVRVEDGVVLLAVESLVTPGAWDQMQSAVEPLTRSLALEPGVIAAIPSPLTAEQLEHVSEARRLQYSGELVAAEKIYSSALAQPSSSWRAEADYLKLMADLGMKEWAEHRAARILGSMPKDPALVCETARMMIQSARGKPTIAELREAVRTAASCGDRFVIAHALYRYSISMWSVHVPTARAALDEAKRQLGDDAKESWLRCAIDFESRWDDYAEGHIESGRDAIFKSIGEACVKAGNSDIASRAFRQAGFGAFALADRRGFFEQAVAQAEHAGGAVRDRARIELADELTRVGRTTEADDLVLAVLKEHLAALAALQGGLADPEARLDDELLRRAGVERGAARRELDAPTTLLVKIHRRALALGLRWWATRTRVDSTPQAGAYDDAAAALDPQAKPVNKDADKAFEARLAAVRLSVDAIVREERPLRGSGVDLVEGLNALWGRYSTLKGRDAAFEQLDEICKAMTTAAGWLDNDDWRVTALRCQSDAKDHAGQIEAAIGILRGARTHVRSHETHYSLVTRQGEILGRTRHAEAVKPFEEARDLARHVDVSSWVKAAFSAEYERVLAGEGAADGVTRLLAISRELEAAGDFETAATALVKASSLWNAATHSIGSPESTALYFERARVLDKLGDPMRSARAWVDVLDAMYSELAHVYRGGAKAIFARDPRAKAIIADVKERLDAFVAKDRKRDAARVGTRLIGVGAPELVDTVTGWAKSFEDSSEFPEMMGWLLQTRADSLVGEAKREMLRQSRDQFAKANRVSQAIWVHRSVLSSAGSEEGLWRELQVCVDLAHGVHSWLATCFEGVGDAGVRGVEPRDAEQARKAVALGIAARSDWKRDLAPSTYVDAIAGLAGLAVVAHDLDTYHSIDAEVRAYYTKASPDPYQLVSYFSRVASVVGAADRQLAVSLHRAFEEGNGASCTWKAGEYYNYARDAHEVGDREAEKLFVSVGRSCAEQIHKYLANYDLYLVPAMRAASDYEGMRKAYEAARKTLKQVAPGYLVRQDELALDIAATHLLQNHAGPARKALAEAVKRAEAAVDGSTEAPCFESLILEAAASIELAAGTCVEAKKLTEKAATLRSRCKSHACISVAAAGGIQWCDGPDDLWLRANNGCGKPPTGVEQWIRR